MLPAPIATHEDTVRRDRSFLRAPQPLIHRYHLESLKAKTLSDLDQRHAKGTSKILQDVSYQRVKVLLVDWGFR